jgi:hypothetical protein
VARVRAPCGVGRPAAIAAGAAWPGQVLGPLPEGGPPTTSACHFTLHALHRLPSCCCCCCCHASSQRPLSACCCWRQPLRHTWRRWGRRGCRAEVKVPTVVVGWGRHGVGRKSALVCCRWRCGSGRRRHGVHVGPHRGKPPVLPHGGACRVHGRPQWGTLHAATCCCCCGWRRRGWVHGGHALGAGPLVGEPPCC